LTDNQRPEPGPDRSINNGGNVPHHLGPVDTSAEAAIVTGDPERVELLADALGVTSQRWTKRGYAVAEVTVGDRCLLVCSTGIGGPSLAIAVEELGEVGVSAFVRVGTCGALQPWIQPGELVMSIASVRDEGTSFQYLPATYPAVADFYLLQAMAAEAQASGRRHFIGITHAKDAYYAESHEGHLLASEWIPRWAALRSAGVLATEMEAAALFTIATVRSWRAAAVCVAVDDALPVHTLRDSLQAAACFAARALLTEGIRLPETARWKIAGSSSQATVL
jgi:uridine phosphorylase